MDIQLFSMTSEKNRIGKTMSSLGTLSGNLREECSIIQPVIRVQGIIPNNCNYFYIPEFQRFYFMNSPEIIRENLYNISGVVDVLESWKTQILSNNAIIGRQENLYNVYLQDSAFRTQQNTRLQCIEFPDGFSRVPQLVLATF